MTQTTPSHSQAVEAADIAHLPQELKSLRDQLHRAYGHLPSDVFPGPPGSILGRLEVAAATIETALRAVAAPVSDDDFREALRRIQYEAVSLADAQVIALEALSISRVPVASLASREQVNLAACGMGGVQALADVAAERARQISVEGWTPEHDDSHGADEMAIVAAAYADPQPLRYGDPRINHPIRWPRGWSFKPGMSDPKKIGHRLPDRRRDLVRAGALILAEIERFDRAAAPKAQEGGE